MYMYQELIIEEGYHILHDFMFHMMKVCCTGLHSTITGFGTYAYATL